MSSPDRFCDNRYKNWLKCGLALILMKEDLHQLVHNQVQSLHNYLISKVSPLIYGTSATVDCKVCTWRDIKYDRHKKLWHMNCRKNICNVWLQEIIAVHKTPDNPKINWRNCNVSQWPSDPYQVAKAFMPNGQANVTKPEDLDPPAILSLLYYCSFLCKNVPNPQILHDLIEVRNSLFHSGNFYVEDSEKDTWINNMLQLLQDLKLNGTKIEKIKREDLDINFRETEIKVLEALVSTLNSDFKTMCAALNIKINSLEDCQKEQEEKIGKLQVCCSENTVKVVTMETKIESFEKFTQDFSPVKRFFDNNCDILDHDFRNKNTETMSKLQDCFEILKTKLESTDAELTSIKSRVEGVEDLDRKVSGYRVDLENFFRKLEILSGGFVKIQPVVNKWNKNKISEEKNMQSADQTLGDQEQQDRMPVAWTFTKEEIDRAWVLLQGVLVDDLAPSYILSSLTFLSDNERQAICQMESRGEMVKMLLPRVKDQLPDAFCILLNALKEKGPEQLVEKLVKIISGTCILNYAPKSNMSSLTMKLNVKGEDGTIVSETEIQIAGSINKLSSVFSEDLQLMVTDVIVGSVIIHLEPLSKHAQATLAFFCKHGGMKDLVLNLLRKKNIYASLPTGEVWIEVEVCCREEDVVSKDASEPWRDFASESFEVDSTNHVIKENLRLQYGRLLDEIEPLHLKKTFTDKGILDKCFLELRNLERRQERAAYFLDKLLAIGSDEALVTLVDALKESGRENLATNLVAKRTPYLSDTDDVDESLIQVVKVSHKHAEGSILWSCCLKVTVEKNDDGKEQGMRHPTEEGNEQGTRHSTEEDKMAVVKQLEISPFNADPEQTPPLTKQEIKNQSDSSEGPIMMVKNATGFRPDSRKNNVKNFPVQLFPVDSWQKFEDAYVKGQTNDDLHYIFEQMGVANKLEKGVFQLKLSIHLMPHCDTETGELILLMKEILNRIWDTYLKELDLRPFAEKIGEQVLDDASRNENMEFLLKRLFGSKGINAGLKILKEFCATYPYITKRIDDIMGKRAEDESLLGQELFTATITLEIIRTESTGDMKMNIVFEDPKLHFDTVEDASKAVSSADGHKIIGALFCIDCDTTKKKKVRQPGKRFRNISCKATQHGKRMKVMPNTGKHRQVLNRCMPDLVRDLHFRKVSLCIQEKELFDDVTMRVIREQRTTSEQIMELISHIQQSDQDTYNKFKECLVQANQSYLKDKLEEEEAKLAIEIKGKLHETILNRCLPELVSDLDVTVVCMHVQQREVLDHVTVRDILEQKTTSDKTRELIKQIQERDQDTYEKFKECLVQAKQEFLKVMLEEEEAKYAKEIEVKRHLKRKRSTHDDDTDFSAPS